MSETKLGEILGNPEKVVLGDGKEYELYPLNLNDLADIETRYGGLEILTTSTKLSDLRFLLYLMMRKTIKDLKEEDVGNKITMAFLGSSKINNVIQSIKRLNETGDSKNEKQPKETK